MPMQRLDANAERIVKLANEIAHEVDLEYVGTEHVLLAIIRHGGGLGAAVLQQFGVDEAKAQQAIEEIVMRDKEDTWVFGRLPGSPHFRNVMAVAINAARQLDASKIGSEHLLLALLAERNSTGQRALQHLGVTRKAAEEEILRQLRGD